MNANSVDSLLSGVDTERLPSHPGYLAHWGSHLEAGVREQIARVDAVPEIARTFNYPFPVNYVLMLTPRGSPTDDTVRAIRHQSTPLNDADQAFRRYCEELAAGHGLGERPELAEALRGWRAVHESGANLDAVRFVEIASREIAEGIRGFPGWDAHLAAHAPALRAAFVELPESFVRVRRINVFRPYEDSERVLAGLARVLAARSDRRADVTRIEVAKHSAVFAEPGLTPTFPTLIVYLDTTADLCTWWRLLVPLLMASPATEVEEEYARRLGPGVTYTEGFRLYKRYLAAIGLLDAVYDPEVGYASAVAA